MKSEFWSVFFSTLIIQFIMFSFSSFIIQGLYPNLTGFLRLIAYAFTMSVIMMIFYSLSLLGSKKDGGNK